MDHLALSESRHRAVRGRAGGEARFPQGWSLGPVRFRAGRLSWRQMPRPGRGIPGEPHLSHSSHCATVVT